MKAARLNLRLSEEADDAIRRGAAVAGTSVSEFVVHAATERAQRELADRTRFVLEPDQWRAFCDLLERPPRSIPAVAQLLAADDIFE